MNSNVSPPTETMDFNAGVDSAMEQLRFLDMLQKAERPPNFSQAGSWLYTAMVQKVDMLQKAE